MNRGWREIEDGDRRILTIRTCDLEDIITVNLSFDFVKVKNTREHERERFRRETREERERNEKNVKIIYVFPKKFPKIILTPF